MIDIFGSFVEDILVDIVQMILKQIVNLWSERTLIKRRKEKNKKKK